MAKDSTRERILDAVISRMLRYGYRKMTMDEIAQDLVMSKNTIYRYFPGKIEIAEALFLRLKKEINHELFLIEESHDDPYEIISKNIFYLQQRLGPWYGQFLSDIKTELPDLWSRFTAFRNEKLFEIKSLVQKGITKRKFRKINPAVAVRMYMGAVDYVLNPEFLAKEKISFSDALQEIQEIWSIGVHLRK